MRKGSKCSVSICLVLFFLMVGINGEAQSQPKYPTRPISVVVPYNSGGTLDTVTRITSMYMSEKLGVPVNVINKGGGNCIPGVLEAITAAPDGYTLLAENGAGVSTLVLYKQLPFENLKRTFINTLTNSPLIFVVPASSSIHTLDDLAKTVKKSPETFAWISSGSTASGSFVVRQFFAAIGVDAAKTREVPTKGGSEQITQIAGGHASLTVSGVTAILPAIRAGQARAIATSMKQRISVLPDVPTTSELGYPSINGEYWHGYSGPPNLPSYVVDTWNKTLQAAIKDPAFLSRFDKVGAVIVFRNPAETKAMVLAEMEDVKKLYAGMEIK